MNWKETINSAHKEAINFDSMSEIDSFIKNHNPYRNDQEKENVNKIRENFNYKKLKDPKTKMLLFLNDNLMVFYDVLETIVIGTKGVFNKDNLNFLVKKDNQDDN